MGYNSNPNKLDHLTFDKFVQANLCVTQQGEMTLYSVYFLGAIAVLSTQLKHVTYLRGVSKWWTWEWAWMSSRFWQKTTFCWIMLLSNGFYFTAYLIALAAGFTGARDVATAFFDV